MCCVFVGFFCLSFFYFWKIYVECWNIMALIYVFYNIYDQCALDGDWFGHNMQWVQKNSLLIIWLEACHNLGHNTLVRFVDIIENGAWIAINEQFFFFIFIYNFYPHCVFLWSVIPFYFKYLFLLFVCTILYIL